MKILSCAFNMDTACVELKMADGTMISIDCTAVPRLPSVFLPNRENPKKWKMQPRFKKV